LCNFLLGSASGEPISYQDTRKPVMSEKESGAFEREEVLRNWHY
jgi:hypothetical protein